MKKNALPLPKDFKDNNFFTDSKSIALGDQDFLKVENVKDNSIVKMIQDYERNSIKKIKDS